MPPYHARLAGLVEEFGEAKSKGLGTNELAQIAEAAVSGRIATRLIEANRQIPGRTDNPTGWAEFNDPAHPEVDDLLDDLGELVLKRGGQVVVVPAEPIPNRGAGGILTALLAMLLFATGGTAVVAHARDAKSALTADRAMACIRTAVAARPGLVKKVEVEEEDGKQLCEVKIIAETGQKYELHVDLDANIVVKTEED
jgi:hypothetical protein